MVEANPAFAQALGYESPAAVLAAASAMDALTEPAAWTHAVSTWQETAPGSAVVDTRWKRADGSLATLRLTGRRRAQADAGETRIEIVAENVSAQRALEAQVRRGRRWEDVARLTTGIASDLRGVVEDDERTGPRHHARSGRGARRGAQPPARRLRPPRRPVRPNRST